MNSPRFCLIFVLTSCLSVPLYAEWPQILGPLRTGHAAERAKLTTPWPAIGPKLLWKRPVDQGFAGVAISGEPATVYLFERVQDDEVLSAISLVDGAKTLWSVKFPVTYQGTIASDDGPRSVPSVTKDKVIVWGVSGNLHCVERVTGRLLWSRELAKELRAAPGYFGFGSTPIVLADRVIVNVGATNGAGIVAVNLADGKTLWQETNDAASYAAPIVIQQAEQQRIAMITRLSCVWLDPATGKVLSRVPFGARGPTVNAATPIVDQERLFLTASYGIGSTLLQIKDDQLKPLWASDELLSSQYTTPLLIAPGKVIGLHGRQDVGVAELRAVDLQKQQVLWSEKNFGSGHLIATKDKILAIKTTGEAVVFAASAERYQPLANARLTTDTVQALPALSQGKLLLRDTKTLYCYEVGE